MSSLKMTFSLASLILIFAFVAMPVMAHDNASGDDIATPRPHSPHPFLGTLPAATDAADVTAGRAGTQVTPHGVHPTVSSIELKPHATLKNTNGRNVLLLNDAGDAILAIDGADAGEFTVTVTFSGKLASDAILESTEVTLRTRYSDGSVVGTPLAVDTTVVGAAGQNVFDVTINVPAAAYWDTGPPAASLLPLEVFVDIIRGAVATGTTVDPAGNTLNPAPSDEYRSGPTTKFTILEEFDSTGPIETITADATTANKFQIAFNEALGSGTFAAADLTITNGSAAALVKDGTAASGSAESYTLTVTGDDSYQLVTVALKMNSVEDAFGNDGPATPKDAVASLDRIPPAVMFAVKSTSMPPQLNAAGKAEFTITFTEALGPTEDGLQRHDLLIDNGEFSALAGPANTTDDPQMPDVYTLAVTPDVAAADIVAGANPSLADITVRLDTGSSGPQIKDTAGNDLDLDTAARYVPMGMGTKEATFDRTPPTATVTAPATPLSNGKLVFSIIFSEPVQTPIILDRGATGNYRLLDGPVKSVGGSETDFAVTVTPVDATKPTEVLIPGTGSARVTKDKVGHELAADAFDTYTPPVSNGPPVFLQVEIDKLTKRLALLSNGVTNAAGEHGICVGDPLPASTDLMKRLELPLGTDPDRGDPLTYTLTKGGSEVPRTERASGFYYQNIDGQPRLLLAKSAVDADDGWYVWTVTDSHGASATHRFKIKVEPLKKADVPSGLMAAKVDSAAITTINDKNKVKLTWAAPADKTGYPICQPPNNYYTLYTERWDPNTDTWVTHGSSIRISNATSYTTEELRNGIYRFQLTANNGIGGDTAKSDFAVWTKTAGTHVVVADPPAAPQNTASPIKVDGRTVTLNWLAVPETAQNGAPVYDDLVDASHPDYDRLMRTRAKYYGNDNNGNPVTGDFGGYVVYQIDAVTQRDVKRYPETGTVPLLPQAGSIYQYYDHPSFATPELEPGRYAFRFTAVNIAGESARSLTTSVIEIVGEPGPSPNNRPDFGDATIARIDATQNQQISGRILPEATDADSDDTLTYWIEDPDGVVTTTPGGLKFSSTTRALTGTPTAAMSETLYTYWVSDRPVTINVADGKANTTGKTRKIPFFITVKSATAGPPATSTPTDVLPANGYIVYVRDEDNLPTFGTARPAVAEWAAMPNLYELFTEGGGGSLQLNVAGVGARQVVMSEVMWAVDLGKIGQDSYDGQQWIELRNRTANAIPITSINFVTKSARPALAQGTDLISNVVGAGNNWIKDGKGENGNSTAGSLKAFKSMRRTRYHNDSAGWNPGEWVTAGQVYHPNHYGTPGRGEPQGPVVIGTTNVPRSPMIINEISNNANPAYEWIELKNVSGGNVNLKGWEITMVTAVNSDADLIDFTGADRNVPAGGILLVVKSDPTGDPDHPLAAGWNFGARNTWTVAKPGEANYVPGVHADSPRYMVAARFNALPDNGEFVLILRDHEGKNNTGDHIKDIAGHMPGTRLKVETATAFTHLWPLSNFHDANAEQNKFTSGTVHRRQHAGVNGTDRSRRDRGANADDGAFRDHGWTSVGYKRNATPNAQNGGTPGYAANVLHSTHAAANNAVIISEIMPTTGDRNLPEWIELRNTSRTIGVNVNSWRVTITNHDSDGPEGGTYDGDLTRTITLNGQIPPGQTYLIVARNGRNTTNLPNGRIKNVGRTRSQLLLNTYGFEIKVESKDGNNYQHVDTAGNLGAAVGRRSRSFAPIRWEWPASMDASGNRISIVRAPLNGSPNDDGTAQDAWKSFEGTAQSDMTDESVYYGHQSDFGSPGHTAGGVLPVSLSKFRPERLKDTGEIVIRWTTESELNNAGFNILRGKALDGEFTKINISLIAGKGTTSERSSYTYTDKSAKPNVVYYYQIQDVSLDGEVTTLRTTHLRGNVTAVGKATTTWGKIKALQ